MSRPGPGPAGVPSVLVVQHEDTCPPDRLGAWLADAGVRLQVCRPYLGDEVPPAVDADGLLVLGGHMGAYDDAEAPWLPATRDLLACAAGDGTPTLGVCLGAQLLAVACGGRVEVGSSGIEAGVVDVRWRPDAGDDALFGVRTAPDEGRSDAGRHGEPARVRTTAGPSMHRDAVVELPPGGFGLGHPDRYPHQAFRVGSAWGVQFHPEVSLATFRGWSRAHDADWARDGLDGDEVVDQLARRQDEVTTAGRRLAGRFARLVTDRAQAARGSTPDSRRSARR